MRWASIYAVLGDEFPNAADHAVYRRILDDKRVLPAQRLKSLSAALRRQLFTAKELSA